MHQGPNKMVSRFIVMCPDLSSYRCTKHLRMFPTNAPTITGASLLNGPFVFQPGHLIFTNCFSKQVIKTADFATLKIWLQSDHWFKSYEQKVNFQSTKS